MLEVLFNILIYDYMLEKLYDVMAYLTTNYSSMPKGFKDMFSETYLIQLRQDLFTTIFNE